MSFTFLKGILSLGGKLIFAFPEAFPPFSMNNIDFYFEETLLPVVLEKLSIKALRGQAPDPNMASQRLCPGLNLAT